MSATMWPNPFGPFLARHGVPMVFPVLEKQSDGAWRPKVGMELARWTYRVRGYLPADPTSLIFDEALTKAADVATTGRLDHYLNLGATVRPALVWEVWEIDGENAATGTPTLLREVLVRGMRWMAPVSS